MLATMLLAGMHMDPGIEILAAVLRGLLVEGVQRRGEANPKPQLHVVVLPLDLPRLHQGQLEHVGGLDEVDQRVALIAALHSSLLGFSDLSKLNGDIQGNRGDSRLLHDRAGFNAKRCPFNEIVVVLTCVCHLSPEGPFQAPRLEACLAAGRDNSSQHWYLRANLGPWTEA